MNIHAKSTTVSASSGTEAARSKAQAHTTSESSSQNHPSLAKVQAELQVVMSQMQKLSTRRRLIVLYLYFVFPNTHLSLLSLACKYRTAGSYSVAIFSFLRLINLSTHHVFSLHPRNTLTRAPAPPVPSIFPFSSTCPHAAADHQ